VPFVHRSDDEAVLAAAQAEVAAAEAVNPGSGLSNAQHDDHDDHGGPDPEPTLRVLVYSDDRVVRRQVITALGRRPAADLPALEYVEVATEAMAVAVVDRGGLDLLILDGEAVPIGGMGLCRQLKDEIYHCPPVLLLVGRPQDAWLATWSRADAVTSHPLDAVALARSVATLLRSRVSVATV
jgi:DNA-binding response OmpR family regulator